MQKVGSRILSDSDRAILFETIKKTFENHKPVFTGEQFELAINFDNRF